MAYSLGKPYLSELPKTQEVFRNPAQILQQEPTQLGVAPLINSVEKGTSMDPIITGSLISAGGQGLAGMISQILKAAADREAARQKALMDAQTQSYTGQQKAIDTQSAGQQNAFANLLNLYSGKLR